MNNTKVQSVTEGPLTPLIVKYIIPLMLSGLLQLAYNSADSIIVGRWDGNQALAAVSSVNSLINLIINLFMGISTGVAVSVAHGFGAKDYNGVKKTVHTSVLVALFCGVAVAVIGCIFSKQFLVWTDTPADVLRMSTLYLQIYFLGAPGNLLYNFGAAILRSVGDTRRPLYFLAVSGLINVLLNFVFVIFYGMGVVGVALATIISQYLSAAMVVICLMKRNDCTNLKLRELRIYKDKLKKILLFGVPAGVQSSIFAASNVVIQSSINSFGSYAMAGSGASVALEGFAWNAMLSVYHAALTFIGQCVGAKRLDKINAILIRCVSIVTLIGLLFGIFIYNFRIPLLSMFITDSEQALAFGAIRVRVVLFLYFISGIMEVFAGAQRGLGMSFIPMITTLLGSTVLRIIWVYTVFKSFPTPEMLFVIYPISWIVTTIVHMIFYFVKLHKLKKTYL